MKEELAKEWADFLSRQGVKHYRGIPCLHCDGLVFIQSKIDQAVARERERIEDKLREELAQYYNWNDGCGCCSDEKSFDNENVDDLINSIREDGKEQDGRRN